MALISLLTLVIFYSSDQSTFFTIDFLTITSVMTFGSVVRERYFIMGQMDICQNIVRNTNVIKTSTVVVVVSVLQLFGWLTVVFTSGN